MAKKTKGQTKQYTAGFAPSFAEVPGYLTVIGLCRGIVDYIVGEIIAEMNAAVSAQGKKFSDGALDEWTPKLRQAVFNRLMEGGNWDNEKAGVLIVAHDMAVIAEILSGELETVSKVHVHAAFRACKNHQTCPGNQGSGRWCDFDI